MIDRLIAHLAEGDTGPDASGIRPPAAVIDGVTGVRGTLATGNTSLLVLVDMSWEAATRLRLHHSYEIAVFHGAIKRHTRPLLF